MVVYRTILQIPTVGLETKTSLPRGAQILHVDLKIGDKSPSIWSMVDPTQPYEDRLLLVLPTGIDVPEHWKFLRYISTVQIPVGGKTLCFHIFEEAKD